jgi:hypothetical protein
MKREKIKAEDVVQNVIYYCAEQEPTILGTQLYQLMDDYFNNFICKKTKNKKRPKKYIDERDHIYHCYDQILEDFMTACFGLDHALNPIAIEFYESTGLEMAELYERKSYIEADIF